MELSMKFYPILLLIYFNTCSTCLLCSLSFHLLFSTCLFLSTPPFTVVFNNSGVPLGGGGGGGYFAANLFYNQLHLFALFFLLPPIVLPLSIWIYWGYSTSLRVLWCHLVLLNACLNIS